MYTLRLWTAICAAALSLLFVLRPACAQTAAGTNITESATATYVDPNNSGQTVNSSSNTVSTTVAEVAGMTLTASGVTDSTGGAAILPNHVLLYNYVITNIGNANRQFVIPGTATITGPGTQTSVAYSTDGTNYTSVSGSSATTASVAEAGTVEVRVTVTVTTAAAPANTIAVLIGNVSPNDNSSGTQNQPYPSAPTAGANKCYSAGGSPVNGQREASATQSASVGSQPEAFAAVLLTHGSVTAGVDSQHDILAYNLNLNVNLTRWTGSYATYAPADLTAASITLDGSTVSRVLISFAIPASTVLQSTPTAASGWTVVYTTTATTTNASAAAWTTTAPSTLANTTRVGFVAAGPVTQGTNVTGFIVKVLTSGVSLTAPTTLAAFAQMFGNSSGDPSNTPCYDESGDQNPSNFNDDGTFNGGAPTTGVANQAAQGTDPSNNNTGTGAGGQDNVFTVQPAGAVLAGPNGQPAAIGPNDTNDDYTNETSAVPAGTLPGTTITPSAVAFTNTVENSGSTTVTNNIDIIPMPPTAISGGALGNVPTGTTVRLSYGGNTPLYTYNGTAWSLTSGTAIAMTNLAASSTLNFTATVQLPAGTALSTDTGTGYPIVLRAYVDSNGNGSDDTGEPYDDTVDRVYTGCLKVSVQEQIVDTNGTTIVQAYGTTLTTSNMIPGRFLDYLVTYQNISSSGGTNCTQLMANSVTLTESGILGGSSNNWALDNDSNGVIDTSNVAGKATDSASGVVGFFSGAAGTTSCSDQTGTTAATDVTRYVDTAAGSVGPGVSRTFTFRRKLN